VTIVVSELPQSTKPAEKLATRRLGRPRFEATPERKRFVRLLVGMAVSREDISEILGIHKDTLAANFARELAVGSAKIRAEIVSKWYEALGRGERWAVEWGLKHRCGFTEAASLQIDVGAAEPINVRFVTPTGLVDEPPEPPRLNGFNPASGQRLLSYDPGKPNGHDPNGRQVGALAIQKGPQNER
jgi:hypothetical protein